LRLLLLEGHSQTPLLIQVMASPGLDWAPAFFQIMELEQRGVSPNYDGWRLGTGQTVSLIQTMALIGLL
jgi:hypothetical protein